MAATASVDIGSLIRSTPGVNGGRPYIAGTGISVSQIAAMFNSGLAPEEIEAGYPHVGIAAVYAAVARHMANREAIDAELREGARTGITAPREVRPQECQRPKGAPPS
jgi:uncharacterized protein (DUF433 family)